MRDRVNRAQAGNVRWDADGHWAEACGELARRHGLDPGVVYDEHCERAAVRVYLGELNVCEAERLAFEDVLERFEVRR